jgi:hypothetical protein
MLNALRPALSMGSPSPRRVLWLALLVAALLIADYALYPRLVGVGGLPGSSGENGLWLPYPWYFGQHTDDETARLAQQLHDRQIRYAFFHIRDIAPDGTLQYHRPESARRLVTALHRRAPEVKAIAWVYAGNRRGRGGVRLSDAAVRRRMVSEAVWLTEECGFDGVQWDYEVCKSGDPHFLSLLRETRDALPKGAFLSAAAPVWAPWPFTARWGWSEDYLASVAQTCDQIAVMGYDTGLWLPRAYVWLMRQQPLHVTRAVARANAHGQVIIGVPTYDSAFPAHCAHAENLRLALKAVREGLARPGVGRSTFAGVAPFADYTTDAREWAMYESLWLGHPPAKEAP